MLKLLVLLLLFPQQSGGLLDSVNSQRGGRHWIDQEPAPAKAPADSLKCFQLEPGSRIELVAAEPLVIDPVWIDFDHRGRMFVVEYSDYPIGPVKADDTVDEEAPSLSKIVLLEDTNKDGRMDKRTVFADKLTFCHSFMPLMDGILACAQTRILYLKDTDGDNVADLREVWFDGFTPAHAQMQIGCPRFGMDNWIYLTYAPGNIVCRRPGFETSKPVKLPRQDMRFHPLTMEFQPISGMGQFGNTINNDGYRFFSTNRNPVMMEVIPEAASKRNPFANISKRHTDVGPSGGDTRVFPLVDMKSNWLAHAGTHTSACGVTAYRGDLWNSDFQNSVFACEPIGHLVTRSIIEPIPGSPTLTTRRAREKADFLASSDTWFRPSSLRTGPNGALFVADMYRQWVEHPKFLPPEIAAQIDWRAGDDKGRIWRIVPAELKLHDSFRAPLNQDASPDAKAIVEMLSDPNGWRRQTAQRLLIENSSGKGCYSLADAAGRTQRDAAVSYLRGIATAANSAPQVRQHAVHSLNALDSLTAESLTDCLQASTAGSQDFPKAQQAALRATLATLVAERIGDDSQMLKDFHSLLSNVDTKVAHQAMLSIPAGVSSDVFHSAVMEAAKNPGHWNDSWYQKAVQTVAGEHPGFIAGVLMHHSTLKNQSGAPMGAEIHHGEMLRALAKQVAAQGRAETVRGLLQLVAAPTTARPDVVAALLGFNDGAKRNSGPLKYRSFESLLSHPEELAAKGADAVSVQQLTGDLRQRVREIIAAAGSEEASPQERAIGLQLLAMTNRRKFSVDVPDLLSAGQPTDVQVSAINIIREFNVAAAFPDVLKSIPTLAPAARADAVALFLTRTASTVELLSEMESGNIPHGIIAIDQRVRLLQHKDADIKKLATAVFGGVVSADRKAVADEYQASLTMEASKKRGAAVFEKTCVKCHRIDGKGHNVGPDISDTKRRSRDALLYDILDPNRRVDPQFSEYIVLTNDGLTYNGLLVSDSGEQIVLRQPEGKERTIARADIEEMQATRKSLMPEGIEKDVSVQQMADLLQFLKDR